ncbi:hypothetical protein L6Q96_16665 [Candidatus Binatia bacterium]|nr:hypothetical protein [Candidatus Binatia bacterium]
MGKSPLQLAAEALAERLDALDVEYAVGGALAVNYHGVMRATEDVDVLIGADDLARFKECWLGRGYAPLFPGSKAIRDAVHGVKIDFMIVGDYPGDGRPKPVSFPRPADAALRGDRFRVVKLDRLIELKLACALTAPHRFRDLDDVVQLIRKNALSRNYGEQLDPFVRRKFAELWDLAQHPDEEY